MTVDWSAVLLGFAVGVPVSGLFFAGLAWGISHALRSRQPEALLLSAGVWLAASSATAWPMAGYALAFLLVRLVAVLWARASKATALQGREGA